MRYGAVLGCSPAAIPRSRVGHRVTGDRSQRQRGAEWELVQVCVDDRFRVAYAELFTGLPTKTSRSVLS